MRGGHLQAFLFLLNRPEPIRQTSLLMVLATGLGDSRALLAGLKSLAIESEPPFSNRVTQLRVLLEQGQTLSGALATTTGLLPEDTVVAIRLAEDTNTLRQVLADEAHRLASHSEASGPIQLSLPATVSWMMAIAIISCWLLSFVMMFIIPKFKKIFEDFGVELPSNTQALVNVSDWMTTFWFLIGLPLITVIALPVWWFFKAYLQYVSLGRIIGSQHLVRYWSPLITRLLSLSVVANQSLEQGIHSILKELRPGRASEQLSRVRQGIRSGDHCWQLLQKHGFLQAREVRFLESADRAGNLDWGLLHLSRTMERRRARWAERMAAVLQPTVILFAAGIVAYICVALFSPMIKLMNELSVVLLPF